ncbi:hypothetical protein, partial [Klebsiella quasivariicola]|uniref:hypothetical protein n=1 Tax=Klebsiella quasivariicola TaxID=2026240 RepID=UPI002B060B87
LAAKIMKHRVGHLQQVAVLIAEVGQEIQHDLIPFRCMKVFILSSGKVSGNPEGFNIAQANC